MLQTQAEIFPQMLPSLLLPLELSHITTLSIFASSLSLALGTSNSAQIFFHNAAETLRSGCPSPTWTTTASSAFASEISITSSETHQNYSYKDLSLQGVLSSHVRLSLQLCCLVVAWHKALSQPLLRRAAMSSVHLSLSPSRINGKKKKKKNAEMAKQTPP